jgi:hypothetical protein
MKSIVTHEVLATLLERETQLVAATEIRSGADPLVVLRELAPRRREDPASHRAYSLFERIVAGEVLVISPLP